MLQCNKGTPNARSTRGSCPSSGVSKQIRGSSCIGPKEGDSHWRGARPAPHTAARTDRVWCKSRQPSYVRYTPEHLPCEAPLVIALHGCTQTEDEYDHGTGWSS